MANFTVFYMVPGFSRDGSGGSRFLKQFGKMPTKSTILMDGVTHRMLMNISAENMEQVFVRMQGEYWSPNGEARPLIEAKGLHHTSMSVGDCILNLDTGDLFMVDNRGFTQVEA